MKVVGETSQRLKTVSVNVDYAKFNMHRVLYSRVLGAKHFFQNGYRS